MSDYKTLKLDTKENIELSYEPETGGIDIEFAENGYITECDNSVISMDKETAMHVAKGIEALIKDDISIYNKDIY